VIRFIFLRAEEKKNIKKFHFEVKSQ